MHQDAQGTWHVNVTVHGAWSPALGATLDWLSRAPAHYAPRRRTIEIGLPWFLLVDVAVPIAPHRAIPTSLHVAAVTGTTGSEAITSHLFACADVVVFLADTTRIALERNLFAREELEPWLRARGDAARVVLQLDRVAPHDVGYDEDGVRVTERPAVVLDAAAMRSALALGAHPAVETSAHASENLAQLFRTVTDLAIAARETLAPRPSYELVPRT